MTTVRKKQITAEIMESEKSEAAPAVAETAPAAAKDAAPSKEAAVSILIIYMLLYFFEILC